MAAFSIVLAVLVGLVLASFTPAPTTAKQIGAMFKVKVGGGHGSGTHIGNGFMLTAAHVVTRAKDGKVRLLSDRGKEQDGEVLWRNDGYDIALVRMSDWKGAKASRVSCRRAKEEEPVRVRGNPLSLQFVTTWGRIASVKKIDAKIKWRDYLITDFTVQQGMSGGPVYDAKGFLVGVLVGMVGFRVGPFGPVSSQQLAFIVPGDAICGLIPEIKRDH